MKNETIITILGILIILIGLEFISLENSIEQLQKQNRLMTKAIIKVN